MTNSQPVPYPGAGCFLFDSPCSGFWTYGKCAVIIILYDPFQNAMLDHTAHTFFEISVHCTAIFLI